MQGMKFLALSVAVVLVPAAPAALMTVDFDSIPATCCFSDVVPGTGRGPLLVFPGVTLDGGVAMDNTGWSGLASSAPNLYGTSGFAALDDSSLLSGLITVRQRDHDHAGCH